MGLENGYKFLIYTLLPPNWDISINGAQSGIFVQKIVSNRFTVTKSRSKRIRFFRLTNRKMIWQTEKRKKLDLKKMAEIWRFFPILKFFQNYFQQIAWLFWKMCAYYAGFQVGNKLKTNLNPWNFCGLRNDQRKGFSVKHANIVNKSSSSKRFLIIQKSVQEEICRQLNLEYPNFD